MKHKVFVSDHLLLSKGSGWLRGAFFAISVPLCIDGRQRYNSSSQTCHSELFIIFVVFRRETASLVEVHELQRMRDMLEDEREQMGNMLCGCGGHRYRVTDAKKHAVYEARCIWLGMHGRFGQWGQCVLEAGGVVEMAKSS